MTRTHSLFAASGLSLTALLSGCASTGPTLEQHAAALDAQAAAIARIEARLDRLGRFVDGNERHQDEALGTVFERLAGTEARLRGAEDSLARYERLLGQIRFDTTDSYSVVEPAGTVRLP